MTKKNILSIVVALALVAALAVGATLAFFSDEDTATNTFTMGKVDIDLKESDDGKPWNDDDKTWTDEGLTFDKLVPGETTPKMAKVVVAEDSNDCYIAVTVALECEPYDAETGKGFTAEEKALLMTAVENAIDADKWTVTLKNEEDELSLLCVYNEVCAAEAEVILFEEITLPLGDKFVFGNNLAEEEFSLVLNAYAVQADNLNPDFDWYEDMINATPATPTPDPTV